MILSRIVISLPVTARLIRFLGCSSVFLLLGTLCGAPIGAKNAVDMYDKGLVDKKYAEYLCSFSNNASASFVMGFVGNEVFGDSRVGVRIFLIQVFSLVSTAIIMKYVVFGRKRLPKPVLELGNPVGLREAICDSALTMLNLGATAVFCIVCGSAISSLLGLDTVGDAILKSILEFSSGCASAGRCGGSAIVLVCFSIGFSGLSVAMQVRSVIAGKLSIHPFAAGKLISASIMTALAVISG